MTTFRLRAALPVIAAFGVLTLAPATAFANCDWYVKTSLEQQQRNVKMRCGFKGPQWSSDKAAHANWCASVGPAASRTAAQKRQQQLNSCGK